MKAELNIESVHSIKDSILDNFPLGLDQEGEFVTQLNNYYSYEVLAMLSCTIDKEDVEINFSPFRNTGNQYVATFSVIDKNLPKSNSYNMHLQNTSQWLYAGALVYDPKTNEISSHH